MSCSYQSRNVNTQGPPLVSRDSAGGGTPHWADVPDAIADVIGAGASVYKELACATSYIDWLMVVELCPMHCF